MLLKSVTLRTFKIKEDVIFYLFEIKPEMFQTFNYIKTRIREKEINTY